MGRYLLTERGYRVGLLLYRYKFNEIKWYHFILKFKAWMNIFKYKLDKDRLTGKITKKEKAPLWMILLLIFLFLSVVMQSIFIVLKIKEPFFN